MHSNSPLRLAYTCLKTVRICGVLFTIQDVCEDVYSAL